MYCHQNTHLNACTAMVLVWVPPAKFIGWVCLSVVHLVFFSFIQVAVNELIRHKTQKIFYLSCIPETK